LLCYKSVSRGFKARPITIYFTGQFSIVFLFNKHHRESKPSRKVPVNLGRAFVRYYYFKFATYKQQRRFELCFDIDTFRLSLSIRRPDHRQHQVCRGSNPSQHLPQRSPHRLVALYKHRPATSSLPVYSYSNLFIQLLQRLINFKVVQSRNCKAERSSHYDSYFVFRNSRDRFSVLTDVSFSTGLQNTVKEDMSVYFSTFPTEQGG
jgi:hypothetical protein